MRFIVVNTPIDIVLRINVLHIEMFYEAAEGEGSEIRLASGVLVRCNDTPEEIDKQIIMQGVRY